MRYSGLPVEERVERDQLMPAAKPIFSKEIFQFFRELGRHNKKVWMDANRERYQENVVLPFRRLLEELSPAVLNLDERFDALGRRGANFSRINRDIRFAKDKTPYRAQMYVKFSLPLPGEMKSGQLYTGISADSVTVGFRVYAEPKRKLSSIALVAEPRIAENPKWLIQQKKRLSKKYDSYWYASIKGEWTKHDGWPTAANWPKLQGWIVRKKVSPAAATRGTFPADIIKIFRDLYPLLKFTAL
jgi:uncharacterized protein (TIGR02453 family)